MNWRSVMLSCAVVAVHGACSTPPDAERPAPPADTASAAASNQPAGAALVTGTAPAPAAIVVLTSETPREFAMGTRTPLMDQAQLTFQPPILLVRTGEVTLFRNSDEEMHNLNVQDLDTRTQVFNVAVPPEESYRYTFDREGFYAVSCDLHPSMSAQIIVSSTPFSTVADGDGRFVFRDVPLGRYILVAYMGTDRIERSVEVVGGPNEVTIDRP